MLEVKLLIQSHLDFCYFGNKGASELHFYFGKVSYDCLTLQISLSLTEVLNVQDGACLAFLFFNFMAHSVIWDHLVK